MSKLSIDDKVKIYNEKKQGKSVTYLAKKYSVNQSVIKYIVRLIDRHGIDVLKEKKYRKFTHYEKESIIKRVIDNGESIWEVSIDERLSSVGMLSSWISKYKENGYNIVERKRGRPTMKKEIKPKKNETIEEENERLKKENLYLKAELEYSKKLRAVVQARKNQQQKKKSTYYYTLSKIDKDNKNKEIIDKIKEIFNDNKERYGYRRITLELRNQGYNVNHKKVYRIMVKLGLKPLKRNKRKYSSYKGTVGKIADNLIERDFNADKPNKKWYTDVTEFNLRGEKCYLSPILDGYNGEIVSHNISKSPNLEQINDMLNKAFDKNANLEDLIFHSDQGWQYQHESYQQRLKNKGIKQSMSRKGNSMDNGMMENFFGLLKTEMFYDQEDKYKNVDELILAIDEYINYYNYDRIKVKLKGLSPVNYRLQSSN